MEFLIIKNKKIERHINSSEKPFINNDDEVLYEVENFEGIVGEPIAFYTQDWIRKDNLTLMKENLIPIPEDYKIQNEKLIPLTEVERIEKRLDELNPFCKIEEGVIIRKSDEELFKENLISEKEFNFNKIRKLKEFLYKTDWMEQKCLRENLSMEKAYPEYFSARTNAIKIINNIEKIHPELKETIEIPKIINVFKKH